MQLSLLQLLQKGLALTAQALKNVSTWSAHIRELHSWKLSHSQPHPLRRVNVKPADLSKDQSLRQQFSHQSSRQAAEPGDARDEQAAHAQHPGAHYRTTAATSQGFEQEPMQMTSSPQIPIPNTASLPASPLSQQQTGPLLFAQARSSSQQLSPSQRRAQSGSLFAAVAAATNMPPSKPASLAAASYPVVDAPPSETARVFASPAAQAARAYASPEPSPSHPPQLEPGSTNSSLCRLTAERGASPVSPQAATEVAVAEMRSIATMPAATDAKLAQTGSIEASPTALSQRGRDPVPVLRCTSISSTVADATHAQTATTEVLSEGSSLMVADPVPVMRSSPIVSTIPEATQAQTGTEVLPLASSSRLADSVPVMHSSPVLCGSATAVPAPVSIPTPTGMTTTVPQPTAQEPMYAPLPQVEPTVVERSLTPSSAASQPVGLPVTAPNLGPTLRPVGAPSYTAPAAASTVPFSTDRYLHTSWLQPKKSCKGPCLEKYNYASTRPFVNYLMWHLDFVYATVLSNCLYMMGEQIKLDCSPVIP